jgi:hypothetical protein
VGSWRAASGSPLIRVLRVPMHSAGLYLPFIASGALLNNFTSDRRFDAVQHLPALSFSCLLGPIHIPVDEFGDIDPPPRPAEHGSTPHPAGHAAIQAGESPGCLENITDRALRQAQRCCVATIRQVNLEAEATKRQPMVKPIFPDPRAIAGC